MRYGLVSLRLLVLTRCRTLQCSLAHHKTLSSWLHYLLWRVREKNPLSLTHTHANTHTNAGHRRLTGSLQNLSLNDKPKEYKNSGRLFNKVQRKQVNRKLNLQGTQKTPTSVKIEECSLGLHTKADTTNKGLDCKCTENYQVSKMQMKEKKTQTRDKKKVW